MFIDSQKFEFVSPLEAASLLIKQEFQQLKQEQLVDWPEKNLYREGWKVFSLYSFGQKHQENCQLCPNTTQMIEAIPGMKSAGFSCLDPGTIITPHVGYSSYSNLILRCHLGIIIPNRCAITVGNKTEAWKEGKCLIFDDSVEHSAYNMGKQKRIILLIDFLDPNLQIEPKFKPNKEVEIIVEKLMC